MKNAAMRRPVFVNNKRQNGSCGKPEIDTTQKSLMVKDEDKNDIGNNPKQPRIIKIAF